VPCPKLAIIAPISPSPRLNPGKASSAYRQCTSVPSVCDGSHAGRPAKNELVSSLLTETGNLQYFYYHGAPLTGDLLQASRRKHSFHRPGSRSGADRNSLLSPEHLQHTPRISSQILSGRRFASCMQRSCPQRNQMLREDGNLLIEHAK
jgi:hypothetical protein